MPSQPSVAIIGAGLAGLTCGTALRGLVDRVRIFEKSVFPGGRVSHIRAGDYEFNHGAQFFTVNNPLFWNIVSGWQTDGIVRPWDGWIVELHRGQVINSDLGTQRFVGVPRMQTVSLSLFRFGRLRDRLWVLGQMGGVEETVELRLGDEVINAQAETDVDRSTAEGKASSVHFLHFPFTREQIQRFRDGSVQVVLAITHPQYAHMAVMPENVRQALAEDFD